MASETEHKFLNYYHCDRCNLRFSSPDDCQCDDDCPVCGNRHLSPFHSADIEGEEFTGPLKVFKVEYFSAVDWRWIKKFQLAHDPIEIWEALDTVLGHEHRNKPHRSFKEQEERPFYDSLEISEEDQIKLPFDVTRLYAEA